jgi:hypothetical protein
MRSGQGKRQAGFKLLHLNAPFLLLAIFMDQWTKMETTKRSGLNLEFIFYGGGMFRVRIEGFFSESYTIVPINKYYG